MKKWFWKCFWKYYGVYKRGEIPRFWRCPRCEKVALLLYTPSMTMYLNNQGRYDEKANYVGFLCRICREEYNSYWQERWDEYYSGRL